MRRPRLPLSRLAALGALALALPACTSTARLTGRWVLLTSETGIAVGQADRPNAGGPLHLVPGSPAPGVCLPPEELERSFGPTCAHEPEGESPAVEARVRWYCHGDLAVRVRVEPCERRERVRVVELAVATHPL